MPKTQDMGLIPALGRPPGRGRWQPTPVNRGAWQATVRGIARVGQDLVTETTTDSLAVGAVLGTGEC